MGDVVDMAGDTIVGRPDDLAGAAQALRLAADSGATVEWSMEPERAAQLADILERALAEKADPTPQRREPWAELRGQLAGWTWRDWLLPVLALWLGVALLWG